MQNKGLKPKSTQLLTQNDFLDLMELSNHHLASKTRNVFQGKTNGF